MDVLERLIAAWEGPIGRAFLTSVRALRDRVSVRDLAAAIAAKDVERALGVIDAVPALFQPLADAMAEFYGLAGREVTATIPRGAVGLRVAAPIFDARATAADDWIRERTARLVRQITEDQRNLVRVALAPLAEGGDPLLTGNTPEKLALDLVGRVSRATGHREDGVLGLTVEQARWAANYEAEIGGAPPAAAALERRLRDRRFDRSIERAIREGVPLSEKTRDAMIAAYRNRTLRMRGELIAKTEADAIAIAAQQEAWAQAVARGAVEEGALRRHWLTVGDDAVRPTHAAVARLNPGGVGFREPFQTPKGPTMQPGWDFDPGCRCRVRIRVAEPA